MSDITRVLRKAALRLVLTRFLSGLVIAATVALGAAILLRVAEQVLGLSFAWQRVALWGPASVVVVVMISTLVRRHDRLAVARRVDEGADLRESLSTALCAKDATDPWSRAVVETAVVQARTVDLRRALPVQAPRTWPMPLVAALALLVVWLLPINFDLLGRKAAAQEQTRSKEEEQRARAEARKAEATVQELIAKVDPKLAEPEQKTEATPPKTPEAVKPQEVRREALKRLTTMADRLEEIKSSAKMQTAEQLSDKMKQLRSVPGPLSELSKELAQGNFAKAGEALQKLTDELSTGQMSKEQQEKLAEGIKALADQLKNIAEERKEMEQKLAEAGLDKKLAADPKALAQALAENKNLSEAEKDQLKKASEAMEQACQACSGMGEKMGNLAQAMAAQANSGQQGMSQEAMQAMSEMAGQLSEMEMMSQDLQNLEAAMASARFEMQQMSMSMGQCDNPGMGACQGGVAGGQPSTQPWSAGESAAMGEGQGGPGRGRGGSAGETADDEKWQKLKARTALGQGPIIGTTLVEGEQVRGESRAEFAAVVEEAAQKATESIENNVIERQYQGVIKAYFDSLKEQGKPATGSQPAKPASEKPAEKSATAKPAAAK